MTTTDTILFVKEAKTCSYVLVIHTPRLCGVPGFRSLLDSREEAIVRCRQIVDPSTHHVPADQGLVAAEADQPYHLPRRKPVLSETALHKEVEMQATAAEGHPRKMLSTR
jgi:protein OS-9